MKGSKKANGITENTLLARKTENYGRIECCCVFFSSNYKI